MNYPTKEKLLASIQPNMKLDRAFFLKVYGYEISFPGYAEIVITVLEDAGCSKARSYYTSIVETYERERYEELKPVAKWLREKIDSNFEKTVKERGEELRTREKKMQDLLQKSDRELLNLLQAQNLI